MKLIVPYKKCVSSHIGKEFSRHLPSSCIVVGLMTHPVKIEADEGGGTIGIEFKPSAACNFFNLGLDTFTNKVCNIQDAWENPGVRMQEQLSNIDTIEEKIEFLQKYLLRKFEENHSNKVVEYAIEKIVATSGFVSISQLSEDIVYSRQHLSRLFKEKVGVSPKELARIVRFQQFYRRINTNAEYSVTSDLYDYYYDQSHFIKEFKNFLGFTPGEYNKVKNDFGKIFYR